jgi:hypothetical protein
MGRIRHPLSSAHPQLSIITLPKALGFLLQETVHRMSFKRLDKAETPFFDGVFD